jgi:hypothetical protein
MSRTLYCSAVVLLVSWAADRPAPAAEPSKKSHPNAFDILDRKVMIHFYKAADAPEECKRDGVRVVSAETGDTHLLTQLSDYSKRGRDNPTILPWRDELLPAAKWDEYERLFAQQLAAIHGAKAAAKAGDAGEGETGPAQKQFDVKHKFPFQVVRMSSDGVAKLQDVASILYLGSPSEVTAAGAVLAGGLVAFDDLAGGEGLTLFSALPFTTSAVFFPNNPEKFLKNVINPVSLTRAGIAVTEGTWRGVKLAANAVAKKPLEALTKTLAPAVVIPGVANEAERAAKKVLREGERAAEKVGKAAGEAAKDTGKAAEKVITCFGGTAKKAAKAINPFKW